MNARMGRADKIISWFSNEANARELHTHSCYWSHSRTADISYKFSIIALIIRSRPLCLCLCIRCYAWELNHMIISHGVHMAYEGALRALLRSRSVSPQRILHLTKNDCSFARFSTFAKNADHCQGNNVDAALIPSYPFIYIHTHIRHHGMCAHEYPLCVFGYFNENTTPRRKRSNFGTRFATITTTSTTQNVGNKY